MFGVAFAVFTSLVCTGQEKSLTYISTLTCSVEMGMWSFAHAFRHLHLLRHCEEAAQKEVCYKPPCCRMKYLCPGTLGDLKLSLVFQRKSDLLIKIIKLKSLKYKSKSASWVMNGKRKSPSVDSCDSKQRSSIVRIKILFILIVLQNKSRE